MSGRHVEDSDYNNNAVIPSYLAAFTLAFLSSVRGRTTMDPASKCQTNETYISHSHDRAN
jgi:hypothetical protein